jgi:hypothetical protein
MISSNTSQIISKNRFILEPKKIYIYIKKRMKEKVIIGMIEIKVNGTTCQRFLMTNLIFYNEIWIYNI